MMGASLFGVDRSDSEGVTNRVYELYVYDEDVRTEFTPEEKFWLRPIAETIAMLDGNAFFTVETSNGGEWYEQYLPEAWALWKSNGGIDGWAGEVGWVGKARFKNPAVAAAWEQFKIVLELAKENK